MRTRLVLTLAAGMVLAATSGMAFDTNTVAGLVFWLKADAGVEEGPGNPAEHNDTVTNWIDQSGCGHSVSQSEPANRPTYVTNVIDGKPVLRFNAAANTHLAAASFSPTGTLTVFAVRKYASFPGYQFYLSCLAYTNSTPPDPQNGGFGVGADNVGTLMYMAVTNGEWLGILHWTTHDLNSEQFGIDTSVVFDNTTDFYIDGLRKILYFDKGGAVSPVGLPIHVGNDSQDNDMPFTGDIAEVLIYDRPLTDAELDAVGYYLQQKYGIAGAWTDGSFTKDTVSGLELWLRADAGPEQVEGNPAEHGETVGWWSDASGADNQTVQGTPAYRPTYISNAVNGRPVVRFDRATQTYLTTFAYAPTGEVSVFVVRNHHTFDAVNISFEISTLDNTAGVEGGFGFGAWTSTDNSLMLMTVTNGLWLGLFEAFNHTLSLNEFGISALVVSSETEFRTNGVPVYLADKGGPIDGGGLPMHIGNDTQGGVAPHGDQWMDGDIAEVLVYGRALTDEEQDTVGWYLQEKYGIEGQYQGPAQGTMIFVR